MWNDNYYCAGEPAVEHASIIMKNYYNSKAFLWPVAEQHMYRVSVIKRTHIFYTRHHPFEFRMWHFNATLMLMLNAFISILIENSWKLKLRTDQPHILYIGQRERSLANFYFFRLGCCCFSTNWWNWTTTTSEQHSRWSRHGSRTDENESNVYYCRMSNWVKGSAAHTNGNGRGRKEEKSGKWAR